MKNLLVYALVPSQYALVTCIFYYCITVAEKFFIWSSFIICLNSFSNFIDLKKMQPFQKKMNFNVDTLKILTILSFMCSAYIKMKMWALIRMSLRENPLCRGLSIYLCKLPHLLQRRTKKLSMVGHLVLPLLMSWDPCLRDTQGALVFPSMMQLTPFFQLLPERTLLRSPSLIKL